MKYLDFRSRAEFYRTPLKPSFFIEHLAGLEFETYGWAVIKPLILHQDCPEFLREPYMAHPLWYVRLTAMLNKFSWRKYAVRATKDPKSTVRAAAYKRLLENIGESPIKALDLLAQIEEDKRTHNYFNMTELRTFLIQEGQS